MVNLHSTDNVSGLFQNHPEYFQHFKGQLIPASEIKQHTFAEQRVANYWHQPAYSNCPRVDLSGRSIGLCFSKCATIHLAKNGTRNSALNPTSTGY